MDKTGISLKRRVKSGSKTWFCLEMCLCNFAWLVFRHLNIIAYGRFAEFILALLLLNTTRFSKNPLPYETWTSESSRKAKVAVRKELAAIAQSLRDSLCPGTICISSCPYNRSVSQDSVVVLTKDGNCENFQCSWIRWINLERDQRLLILDTYWSYTALHSTASAKHTLLQPRDCFQEQQGKGCACFPVGGMGSFFLQQVRWLRVIFCLYLYQQQHEILLYLRHVWWGGTKV